MNGKKSKAIRKQMKPLFLEWLAGLLPEEEAKNLNEDSFNSYLPKETHLYIKESIRLHAFLFFFLIKHIKIFSSRNPNVNIASITLEDLKTVYETRR